MVLSILVAVVVLPFALGYWVGHQGFAALAFLALGFTVLVQQVRIDEGQPHAMMVLGIALSCVLSAASAYTGARVRERDRRRL